MEDQIKSPGNSIQGQGSSNYKSWSLKIGNWVYPDELRKNVILSAGWNASHFYVERLCMCVDSCLVSTIIMVLVHFY